METIIIATDFSAAADNALLYGVELAIKFNSKLILAHASQLMIDNPDAGITATLLTPNIKEYAEERLGVLKDELIKQHPEMFSVDIFVQEGEALEVVEQAIKHNNADVVILGITEGAGKFKEFFIGSNALKIARHVNIPVLIIPERVQYKEIHKISFACDLKKTEETDLVDLTKFFVKLFNASLEVIHVQNPREEMMVEKAKSSYFVEQKLKNTNHRTYFMQSENPAQSLQEFFITHPTDLIVINPKQHSLFHYLFYRSVSKELAFHSKIPILAIH